MKEAIVSKGPVVKVVDSPIPEFNDDQVLIKIAVSGSNPKDWKIPEWLGDNNNSGDDIAGVVDKVGANVTEFRPGDRVAAFHEMRAPAGSYAEYGVAWQHTTFHIPEKTSFEEAAAIPLAAFTAVVGLYSSAQLGLPQPWTPATKPTPLVIYGASSAVGSYTVQLARKSNIHPILAVAGKSQDHVKSLIDESKGDVVVDYRQGEDAVVQALKKAAGGANILYAYDAISEKGSYQLVAKVLDQGGKVTTVLPVAEDFKPDGIEVTRTMVGSVHNDEKDLGFVFSRYFTKGLYEGWFKGQPQEIVPGGLGGVQQGLSNLKEGKASAIKYVFRIADTEGIGKP